MNTQMQYSGAVDNERPAYAQFEEREQEDRAATIKEGHYVGKMRHLVILTRPGARDTLEKWVDEWLSDMREKARRNIFPMQWFQAYEAQYKEWASGVTTEGLTGTPLATWPPMGKALLKVFVNAGIRTVEDLAQVPDADLQNVGTGATGMKQKAKLWLEQSQSNGKTVEKLNDLTNKVDQLATLVKDQADQLKAKDELIAQLAPAKKA